MKSKESIRAERKEQRAERRVQRVKSKERRAKSEEQRAKSRAQRAKSKEQRTESREQRAEGKGQRAKSRKQGAGSEHPFLPLFKGEYGLSREGVKQVAREISTVYNIKKPSAIEFYVPAEGCISESRAVRACLMIRVFNN